MVQLLAVVRVALLSAAYSGTNDGVYCLTYRDFGDHQLNS